jgi:hypothetical protein
MPDGQGHLSPAEIAYILQWINTHHSPFTCPVCDHSGWVVDEYITQTIVFPLQPTPVAPRPLPTVRLSCTGCGYIISFNAVMMGLYPLPSVPPGGR